MDPVDMEECMSKRSEKVTQHIPGDILEPCLVLYMGVLCVFVQKLDDSLMTVQRWYFACWSVEPIHVAAEGPMPWETQLSIA